MFNRAIKQNSSTFHSFHSLDCGQLGGSRAYQGIVSLFGFLTIVLFAGHLNASVNLPSQPIDIAAYGDIKRECDHFLYGIHRNLPIWDWPEPMIKQILKTNLEEYLLGYLNTPESRMLYLKYETVDWNIQEMMRIYLSGEK